MEQETDVLSRLAVIYNRQRYHGIDVTKCHVIDKEIGGTKMKKKNAFRDFGDRRRFVEQRLIDTPLGSTYFRYLEENKFLDEVWGFICSGDYGVSELVRSRCIAVATMGYRGAMEHCQCKRSTLAKSLSRAEPKLCKCIGKVTMELLWVDNLERAKAVYLIAQSSGADGLFPSGVAEMFPAPADTGVSLADCETELKTLRYLTRKRTQKRVANLNQDKLSRLLYIIQSTEPQYSRSKSYLIQMLVKSDDKDYFEACQEALSELQ